MRFAIDENVPFLIVGALEVRGHDCWSVAREAPSLDDIDILPVAVAGQRVLVTFDHDFAELIFHGLRPAPYAMILMKSRPERSKAVVEHFIELLDEGLEELEGKLLVIDERRQIRFTYLPGHE